MYDCTMRDTPIDWPAIKTAYITGDESQRDLAARFGVSPSSIAVACKREGWVEDRKKFKRTTVAKATQKASRAQANALAKIVQASDLLDDVLTTLLVRLAQDGLDAISLNGTPGRELESISKAILNNDELKRRLNGILHPRDAERLKLDREKLEMEKKRIEAEENADNRIIFEIAPDMKELAE